MQKKKLILMSIIIGIALTALSGFIGQGCGLAEPGGIQSGWRGLPIPFYECGTWGDTMHEMKQCVSGNILVCKDKNDKQCVVDKKCWAGFGAITTVLLLDAAFWSFLSYFIVRKLKRMKANVA